MTYVTSEGKITYDKNIKIDKETWRKLAQQKIDRGYTRIADAVRENATHRERTIRKVIKLRKEIEKLLGNPNHAVNATLKVCIEKIDKLVKELGK